MQAHERDLMNGCFRDGCFFPVISVVLPHRAPVPWAIHKPFWMFAAERLGDMTAPAYGQVRLKYFRQFLGGNVTPLYRLLVRAQHGGPMVVPVNPLKGPPAIGARPTFVPLLDNAPYQAAFMIVFDLAETFLSAMFPLRPARALIQSDVCWPALQHVYNGSSGIHMHRRWLSCFRAAHDDLATVPQIRTNGLAKPDESRSDQN